MQVLSVRCGVTKNMGNYESKKLEIEAAPSDGQTAESLLSEVNDYLNQQLAEAGAPTEKKAPLADKPKQVEQKADPSPPDAPQPGGKRTAKSRSTSKANKQADQLEKEKAKRVNYAIESESLGELHERMTELRDFGNAFTPDEWQSVNEKLAARYRELPKDNVEMQDAITKAFKSEKNILAEWRRSGDRQAAVAQAAAA